MCIIVIVIGLELNYGLLLGAQDYFAYNALRFAPTVLAALSLIALWALDELTVESALIAPNLAYLLVLVVGLARSVGGSGSGRSTCGSDSRRSGSESAARARRSPSNVTARLDVAILRPS